MTTTSTFLSAALKKTGQAKPTHTKTSADLFYVKVNNLMEEFDWAMNPDNLESAAFIDKDTIDLDRAVRIPHALHTLIVEAGLPKWIHHSGRKIARVEITTGTGDAIVLHHGRYADRRDDLLYIGAALIKYKATYTENGQCCVLVAVCDEGRDFKKKALSVTYSPPLQLGKKECHSPEAGANVAMACMNSALTKKKRLKPSEKVLPVEFAAHKKS